MARVDDVLNEINTAHDKAFSQVKGPLEKTVVTSSTTDL